MTKIRPCIFSPDERTLYVTNWDPKHKIVKAWDVNEDGSILGARVFFDMKDAPFEEALDGLEVDLAGNLYARQPLQAAHAHRWKAAVAVPTLIHTYTLAGFGAWGIASSAQAESMLASPHTEQSNVILGAKSSASLQNVQSVERAAAFGVAVFGETTLVEDRLELELGVGLSRTVVGVEVAFEPLFKLPLSATHRFTPYLALGPVLLKPERFPLVYGGQLSAGSYVWLHESFGLDLDLSLALLVDRGPALELVLGAGPVLRI